MFQTRTRTWIIKINYIFRSKASSSSDAATFSQWLTDPTSTGGQESSETGGAYSRQPTSRPTSTEGTNWHTTVCALLALRGPIDTLQCALLAHHAHATHISFLHTLWWWRKRQPVATTTTTVCPQQCAQYRVHITECPLQCARPKSESVKSNVSLLWWWRRGHQSRYFVLQTQLLNLGRLFTSHFYNKPADKVAWVSLLLTNLVCRLTKKVRHWFVRRFCEQVCCINVMVQTHPYTLQMQNDGFKIFLQQQSFAVYIPSIRCGLVFWGGSDATF